MGRDTWNGCQDRSYELELQIALTSLGRSNVDGRRSRVLRIRRRELLCARCAHGKSAVGFSDGRANRSKSDFVHGGWKAVCRDQRGPRAICIWSLRLRSEPRCGGRTVPGGSSKKINNGSTSEPTASCRG